MTNYSQLDPLPTNLPFELIGKTIGHGAYASIKKARMDGKLIAVKFIHKRYATLHGNVSERQINMEVSVHAFIGRHPNIIEMFKSDQDEIWRWIAMELAEGGDLFDKIEADAGVSEDIAHFYFTQLISGVSYLHGKGIAHRDIKPENMLLDRDGNLKIADFGLAALVQHNGIVRPCTTICGSPPYVAPEVVTKQYRGERVDIWSSGVVLFVMLAGNTPWDEPSDLSWEFSEYKKTNGRTKDALWQKLPAEVLSLLRGMVKIDSTTRMTLEDVRRHPWFTRSNSLLTENGQLKDRILLATRLIEGLHIDFSKIPNIDESSQDNERLPSTQPAPPTVGYSQIERERSGYGFSYSQPVGLKGGAFSSSAPPPHSRNIIATLKEDPSMSQFAPHPQVPPSLTQAARRFYDICPPRPLTRFFSQLPFRQLLPILSESLHRVGIAVPPHRPEVYSRDYYDPVWIKVQTMDSRRCPLSGEIIVERVAEDISSVEFTKSKGDPLEWRRFFKKIVVLSKDAVYLGDYWD